MKNLESVIGAINPHIFCKSGLAHCNIQIRIQLA